MPTITYYPSPRAAQELHEAIEEGLSATSYEADDYEGATDCEYGCQVESDGTCAHGYRSAALTLGLI